MKWKRPSGSEIETNDLEATISECKARGWEPLEEPHDEPTDNVEEPGEGETEPPIQTKKGGWPKGKPRKV